MNNNIPKTIHMITIVMTGLNKLILIKKPHNKQMYPVKPQKYHATYHNPGEHSPPIQII